MTEIKITEQNKDFWIQALWARRDELADIIDEWYDTGSVDDLRETCDELCKTLSYIKELESL